MPNRSAIDRIRWRPLGLGEMRKSVRDIPFNRQMGEQREMLKDVTDRAAPRLDVDASSTVEQRRRGDGDLTGVRREEPGDAAQQRRLSRTRRAEHNRDPLGGVESDVKRELIGETLANRGRQACGHDSAGTAQGLRRIA